MINSNSKSGKLALSNYGSNRPYTIRLMTHQILKLWDQITPTPLLSIPTFRKTKPDFRVEAFQLSICLIGIDVKQRVALHVQCIIWLILNHIFLKIQTFKMMYHIFNFQSKMPYSEGHVSDIYLTKKKKKKEQQTKENFSQKSILFFFFALSIFLFICNKQIIFKQSLSQFN